MHKRGSDMTTERDAMGADEYHPISHKGSNLSEAGGIGYTVVDALDTMLLMGLDAEYLRARDWVEHRLSFERDAEFNTFEVRLRFLCGICICAMRFSFSDRADRPRSVCLAAFFLHTTTPGATRSI